MLSIIKITDMPSYCGLSFCLCSDEMLGMDQPIHLRSVRVEQGMDALKGDTMGLEGCCFSLLIFFTGKKDLQDGLVPLTMQ